MSVASGSDGGGRGVGPLEGSDWVQVRRVLRLARRRTVQVSGALPPCWERSETNTGLESQGCSLIKTQC